MTTAREETAVLGGGCFWCVEAVFELVRGVNKVVSGYAGGHVANPTYRDVCTGRTGHAEVAQLTFDPDVVTYRQLLDLFFTTHDPTTLNRQGPDTGTQYRSAIYYKDDAQREVAEAAKEAAQSIWQGRIVTEIAPLDVFYPAEDYHQEYFRNNQYQPYCQVIIEPKVAKLRKEHLDMLKA
jgi:peptide-methionine (S)-S-oxide reductase